MVSNKTSCETTSSREDRSDGRYGLCPRCHSTDGYVNFGRDHWFTCNTHKVRWLFGANIFSSWRYESEEEWRENHAQYDNYEEVEPYFYADSQATEPVVETSAELEGREREEGDLDLFLSKVGTEYVEPPFDIDDLNFDDDDFDDDDFDFDDDDCSITTTRPRN